MTAVSSHTTSDADPAADVSTAPMSTGRRQAALLTVALAFVMDLLDVTIVNVAIPSISASMHAEKAVLEWIVAGYALAFAVLLIVGGRLGDRYGYRRVFLVGVALFTATSLLCGLAPSGEALAIGRVLQGATAALMVPQVMALVQVMYPPAQRYKVFAVFGFLGGFSAALGPIVGGLLIDADFLGLGWRSAFLINLPIGVLSLAAGALLLPATQAARRVRIDHPGAWLVIVLALCILVPLIEGPGRDWPWWCVALLLLAAPMAWCTWRYLGWRERRHGDALVPPLLLERPRIALGLLCNLLVQPVIPGYLLVMTFVLQNGHGLSATHMAYACAPIAIGAMVGISLLGPRLHRRLGVRAFFPGLLALAASTCLIGWVVTQPALLLLPLALGQFGMGVGLGLCGPPLTNATLHEVPLAAAGVASGLLSAVQQLAGSIGVALSGLLFFYGRAWSASGSAEEFGGAYLQTLPLFLALLVGAGLIGWRLPALPAEQASHEHKDKR